jgi:hypothetical protein
MEDGGQVRRRLLVLGLILLMAAPLVLVLRDFAREAIVVPLLYVLWLGRLLFRSIPQPLLWSLFLTLVLFVAVRSLGKRGGSVGGMREAEAESPGRVWVWARRIQLAARGDYSRWRLAHYLRKLILDVLAHRERLTPEQLKRRLGTGEVVAPPAVQAYLRAGLMPMPSGPIGLFSRLRQQLRSRARPSPLDAGLESAVQFLENQLEVPHDRRNR